MDLITRPLKRSINMVLNLFKTDEDVLVATLVSGLQDGERAECVEHFTYTQYSADLWYKTESELIHWHGLFIRDVTNREYGRNYGRKSGLFLVLATYGQGHFFEDGIVQTIFKHQPIDPHRNFIQTYTNSYGDERTTYTLSPLYILILRDHKPSWCMESSQAWDNKWKEAVKLLRYFKEQGVIFSETQGITIKEEKYRFYHHHTDFYSLFHVLKSCYGLPVTSEGMQARDDIIGLLVELGCSADVGRTHETLLPNGTKKASHIDLFDTYPACWYPNFDDVLKRALKKHSMKWSLLEKVRAYDVKFLYV